MTNRIAADDNSAPAPYIAPMIDPIQILPGRAILSLTGPDTLTLLERLVTNNTSDWDAGAARYGALLTPQGKVIADFIALRTQTGVLLDVANDHIAGLAKRLKMFRLRSDVTIEQCEDMAVAITATPQDGAFADPRSAHLPLRAFVPMQDGQTCGDYDDRRVANGMAEQGEDFDSTDVFPADINMDLHGGVDLKKGCFVGQEVVSRMHRRGNIRRRTIELTGTDLVKGQQVLGDALLGEITSATKDGCSALARVRVDRLAKADAAKQALTVNDNPVILKKPDWLQQEMSAFIGDD